MSMRGSRRLAVSVLSILGVAALVLGLLITFVARTLFDPDVFARRVAASLDEPGVSRVVAAHLTDALISQYRDLTPYRPILLGTTEYVVSSSPFRALVRRAAREGHAKLVSETGVQISLTVADVGVVLRNALAMHPQLMEKVPPRASAAIASLGDLPGGQALQDLLSIARRLRRRAVLLLLVGLGSGVAAVALSRRKDATLLRLGLGLTVTAYLLAAIAFCGGGVAELLIRSESTGGLVRGLWAAFIGPLTLRALILGSLGLVLVAAVTSLLEKADLGVALRAVKRLVAGRPRHVAWGVLRGVLLIAAGLVVMLRPLQVLQVLLVPAGSLLLFFGIQELFASALRSMRRLEAALGAPAERQASPWPGVVLVGSLVVLLAGAGVFWLVRNQAPAAAAAADEDSCNGDPRLCDRRFDQVTFPTSHNSMSGADIAEWMFPNQEKGIRTQLEDGIRGFLIDAHHGVRVGDKVKTMIEDESAAQKKYEEALGKEGVDAAMRIRNNLLGGEEGEQALYMCHGFCELGATRLSDALEEMRDFLVANPQEVLVVVIQDEGVTPQDIAACFESSGLLPFVFQGKAAPPWPTLREMAATDQRVLVCMENQNEGVPWIHPAFGTYQETPYMFLKPEDFSCAPNRGGTTAPLFQINHWIQTAPAPKPSNAEIVNAYDFLLARVQQCEKVRRKKANLVAVDFYRTGDLFRVVRTLNGLEAPPRP